MSTWLPWILAAAVILVVPVILALFAGPDEPDNTVTQEQDPAPRRDPDDAQAVAA